MNDAFNQLLRRGAALCEQAARPDLVTVLVTALHRIQSPETVVAVVGEFKQGKSSLVNGLLGTNVCPVDDDIATEAMTVLEYGDSPVARISLYGPDGDEVREVPLNEVASYVTDLEHLKSGVGSRKVGFAEIRLPNPFLAKGVKLVDSPGVGGLNPGYMSMTLAYARLADAMLFVTDASAPASRHEIEFLQKASRICPVVLVALTKTDLYAEWPRMHEMTTAALETAGIDAVVFPISNNLREIALKQRRADLNAESGYPDFVDGISNLILGPSAQLAAERATADLNRCLSQVGLSVAAEEKALKNPSGLQEQIDKLTDARQRLDRLRSSGSRWSTLLNDRFTDLTVDVDYEFRLLMRSTARDFEQRIDSADPATVWESLTAELRDQLAGSTDQIISRIKDDATSIAGEIAELLEDEQVPLDAATEMTVGEGVSSLWMGKKVEVPGLAARAGTGFIGLRGAQGGILTFGMMARLAGIALSSFTLVGLGLVFGGKQLFEERHRQLNARRQQAKQVVRQFLDEVQFHFSKDMRDLARQLQREIRDHYSDRIAEMTRTYSQTVDALQRSQRASEAQRNERLTFLEKINAEVRSLSNELAASMSP